MMSDKQKENQPNKGEINQMKTQISSMLKDLIQDEGESNENKYEDNLFNFNLGEKNEDNSNEEDNDSDNINFDEFNDIFNTNSNEQLTQNTTQTQINFTRTNQEFRANTVKAKPIFTEKQGNVYNVFNSFQTENNYENKKANFIQRNNRNSKTVTSSTQDLHDLNNFVCSNPQLVYRNQNDGVKNGPTIRNCFFRKTYNIPIPPLNAKQFNYGQIIPPKRNHRLATQMPLKRNCFGFTCEIEPFLCELEMILNRTNSIDYNLFINIKPKLISLIKTQAGSRILQNYLEKTPPKVISLIYAEVYDKVNFLLLDPYANYFCLKLFCCLNQSERITYLNLIVKNIVTFSVNKIATYPIQCIVGFLISKQEKEIIMEPINKNLRKLALDIYGTHVLEKILTCLEPDYNKSLVKFIVENFLYLANHVNGLCIAKIILVMEYKKEHFPLLKSILITHCLDIIENPYGNYALQIVIDYWDQEDTYEIINKILSKCIDLSMMKYSSNVIERCIKKSEYFLCNFIKETCFNNISIGVLIKNNYGNYVIQTALNSAKNEMKITLINAIENNLNILGEKKLINKWKSILASNIIDCLNQGGNLNNISINQ